MALEETILLNFDIDEAPAVNSIKSLREANSQLRKERDAVNIETKEGRELVDKLNVSIDKNNKLIKDNSSALEKQRQNVGNYSKSIEEAAGNLNIMGTNVGQLGKSLTAFVNPATAAVGVVTALGAAYASSTIGARDLEFASNQLSAATGILTNSFASLFSSAEDGEGAVTSLFNSFLNALGPVGSALAIQSKAIALAKEAIEDLNRNELIARAEINERLAENQELMTQIQDSQTKYEEKVSLTSKIITNLRANEEQILAIKNQQLAAIEQQLSGDQTNEKLLDERALKQLEISAIQKDTERKVGAIQRLESNLLDIETKKLGVIQKQNQAKGLQAGQQNSDAILGPLRSQVGSDPQAAQQSITDFYAQQQQAQRDQAQLTAELEADLYRQRLTAASMYFESAATLAQAAFGEGSELFKALAIGQTIINTYNAATAALAPPPLGAGPVLGPALAALTIATGLANVARIQGVGFAEGGYTGSGGKYQPAGIVHKGEYVTPQHIVKSPAAQPHLAALEGMRLKGYADGGFVANSNMEQVRQAQMLANALKNQPDIFVSWVEGERVGRRVRFKEQVSRK